MTITIDHVRVDGGPPTLMARATADTPGEAARLAAHLQDATIPHLRDGCEVLCEYDCYDHLDGIVHDMDAEPRTEGDYAPTIPDVCDGVTVDTLGGSARAGHPVIARADDDALRDWMDDLYAQLVAGHRVEGPLAPPDPWYCRLVLNPILSQPVGLEVWHKPTGIRAYAYGYTVSRNEWEHYTLLNAGDVDRTDGGNL